MNNNVFQDLKSKVFLSGNPLYLYIGINAIVFVLVALIGLFTFLMQSSFSINEFISEYLALPASFALLPQRFYTIITYIFFHADFFHLLFNMLALFWFGNVFMNFLSSRQFHFVFLAGGLAGAFFFVAALNIFPAFSASVNSSNVIGASAAVMAIIVATATLVPNYAFFLLFFGEVKIKYIAIVYFVLDIIGATSTNAGGSLAHIGGALLGFIYIKRLQSGSDWSKIFERKPKLRVVRNEKPVQKPAGNGVSQQEIDSILDKISSSGYDKLTAAEKEKLFKASKD